MQLEKISSQRQGVLLPAETHMEGAPIERDEVLDLVRERLADILEIDPAGFIC